jgi:hypothetical protein
MEKNRQNLPSEIEIQEQFLNQHAETEIKIKGVPKSETHVSDFWRGAKMKSSDGSPYRKSQISGWIWVQAGAAANQKLKEKISE